MTTDASLFEQNFANIRSQYSTTREKTGSFADSFMRQGLDETFQGQLNLMFEGLKPNPGEEMDPSATTNVMTSIVAMQNSLIANKQMAELAEAMKKSQLDGINQYLGLEAYYDETTKFKASKGQVAWNYELNFDQNDLKNNEKISTVLEVRDKENNLIYTEQGKNLPGRHSFSWNGQHFKGGLAEAGEYSLTVKSTISSTDENGVTTERTINSHVGGKGVIEQVGIENGKRIVVIGGRVIDLENCQKFAHPKSSVNHNDYLDLINKQVTLSNDKLSVNNGKASLSFNNPIQNHGNIRIKVYDQDNNLVAVDYLEPKNTKMGKNEHQINILQFSDFAQAENYRVNNKNLDNLPSVLSNGKYRVEIFAEDLDSGKFEQLNTEITGQVQAISKQDNKITIQVNGEYYDLDDVKEIQAKSNFDLLSGGAANLIGKKAKIDNSLFDFNTGSVSKLAFQLGQLESSAQIKDALINIYDPTGALIDSMNISGNRINTQNKNKVPVFDDLSEASQIDMQQLINKRFEVAEGDNLAYNELNINQKAAIDSEIIQQFLDGKINTTHYLEYQDAYIRTHKIEYAQLTDESKQKVIKYLKDQYSEQDELTYQTLNSEQKKETDQKIQTDFEIGNLDITPSNKMLEDSRKAYINGINGINEIDWAGIKEEHGKLKSFVSGEYKFDVILNKIIDGDKSTQQKVDISVYEYIAESMLKDGMLTFTTNQGREIDLDQITGIVS